MVRNINFIEQDKSSGYIEYECLSGEKDYFSMLKDEDGLWNVSFMPIQ
jgi:hypothetical protein